MVERLALRSVVAIVMLSAEKDNNSIGLCWDETQKESILCSTIVAFQNGIAEGRLWVKLNFLVASSNEVVHDVGRSTIASRTAKPFIASNAKEQGAQAVNLRACVSRKLLLLVFALELESVQSINRNAV
ncbi:hypothetical protein HG531_008137 [Fusarium graminearum]|nr:hypothetical protein HG531_008137 [Fusarium graminearum]